MSTTAFFDDLLGATGRAGRVVPVPSSRPRGPNPAEFSFLPDTARDEVVRRSRGESAEVGRGIRTEVWTGLEKTLDILARTEYFSANVFRSMVRGKNPLVAGAQGITGKSKLSYIDIAADDFGLSTTPLFMIPDLDVIPGNIVESMVTALSSPAGIVGLGLGMVLDPLSWMGFFQLTKYGTWASKLSSMDSLTALKKGSEMGQEMARLTAANGRAPVPLLTTVAEQAAEGQRALFQFVTPWGTPIMEIPGTAGASQKFFVAQTKLAAMARRNRPVTAIFNFFSRAGVPPGALDRMAMADANVRMEQGKIAVKLLNMAEEMSPTDNLKLLKEMEANRLTPERLQLFRTVLPVEDSLGGSYDVGHLNDPINVAALEAAGIPKDAEFGFTASLLNDAQAPNTFRFDDGVTKSIKEMVDDDSFAAIDITAAAGSELDSALFGGKRVDRVHITRSLGVDADMVLETDLDRVARGQWNVIGYRFDEGVARAGEGGWVPVYHSSTKNLDEVMANATEIAEKAANADARVVRYSDAVMDLRFNQMNDAVGHVRLLEARRANHAYIVEKKLQVDAADLRGEFAERLVWMNDVIQKLASFGTINLASKQQLKRSLISALDKSPAELNDSVAKLVKEHAGLGTHASKNPDLFEAFDFELPEVKVTRTGATDNVDALATHLKNEGVLKEGTRAELYQTVDDLRAIIADTDGVTMQNLYRESVNGLRLKGDVDVILFEEADRMLSRMAIQGDKKAKPTGQALRRTVELERQQVEQLEGNLVGRLQFFDDFMGELRVLGGLTPGTHLQEEFRAFTNLVEAYVGMNRHVKGLGGKALGKRKIGRKSDFINAKGKKSDVDVVAQGMADAGLIPEATDRALYEAADRLAQEFRDVARTKPFKEQIPGAKPREGAAQPAVVVSHRREVPANSLESTTSWAEEVSLERFDNLPEHLKVIALDLEDIYSDIWKREFDRGLVFTRRPSYISHIRHGDLNDLKWIPSFTDKPKAIEKANLPFRLTRTSNDTILEINAKHKRQILMEDVLGITLIRGTMSARAVSYADFIDDVVSQFGRNELGQRGAIRSMDRALEFVRQNPDTDIYFPRGRRKRAVANAQPDAGMRAAARKKAARNPKNVTVAEKAAQAVEQTRGGLSDTFNPAEVGEQLTITGGTDVLKWGSRGPKSQKLVSASEEELKRMVATGGWGEAYVLPREVAMLMNNANKLNNTSEGLQAIGQMLERARKTWVPWTLFLFPGYHTRNTGGNIANMMYAGFRNPERFADARWLQETALNHGLSPSDVATGKALFKSTRSHGRNMFDMPASVKKQLESRTWELANGDTLNGVELLDELMRMGIVDSGFAATEDLLNELQRFQKLVKDTGSVKRAIQAAKKGALGTAAEELTDNHIMRLAMQVSSLIENNAKIALYLDKRIKGFDAIMARRETQKVLFDYGDLAEADRFLKTYVAPFWVWMRKNLSLQVEQLLKNPRYFSNIQKVRRVIEAATDPDQEILPTWMHEAFPVRIGQSEEGNSKYQYLVLRNWLPAVELQRLFQPAQTFMESLAPWFSLPLSQHANYNFFFRRPIEEYAGQRGWFLRMSLKRRDIEMLRSVRLLYELDRLMPKTSSDPRQAFQAPFLDRAVSTLGGIRSFEIDLRKQRVVAQRQKRRLERELKIKLDGARNRRDRPAIAILQRHLREIRSMDLGLVLPRAQGATPFLAR